MALIDDVEGFISKNRFFSDKTFHENYINYWLNEFSSLGNDNNFSLDILEGHIKYFKLFVSNNHFNEFLYFDIKKIEDIIIKNKYRFTNIPLDYIKTHTQIKNVELDEKIVYPKTPIYITPFPLGEKTLVLIDGNHRYNFFINNSEDVNNYFIPENFLINYDCFLNYKSRLLYIKIIELNTITRLKQVTTLNDLTIFNNLYMNNQKLIYDYMKLLTSD